MKYLALCLTLLVVSANAFYMPPSHDVQVEQAWNEAQAMIHKLQSALSHKQRLLSTPTFELNEVSQACSNVLANTTNFILECFSNSSAMFAFSDPAQVNASVAAYCGTDGCFTRLATVLNNIKAACTADDLAQLGGGNAMNLAELSNQLKVPCIQYNGEYCFPKFIQVSQGLGVNITAAKLDQLCTPCTRMLLSALQGNNDASNRFEYFDYICEKSNGQYCYLYLQTMAEPNENSSPDEIINYMENVFCKSQCGLFQKIFDDGERGAALVKAYCTLDENGQICARRMITIQGPPDGCPEDPTATSPCSSTCANSVKGWVNGLGCCLRTFLVAIEDGNNTNAQQGVDFVTKQCKVGIPNACAARGAVKANIAVKNLKYSYYQDNKQAVEAKLKKDISDATGAPVDDISVTGATSTSDGITFQIEIKTSNVDQANRVKAELDSSLSSNTLPLPSTATLPPAALVDPTASTSVDASASTTTSVDLSAGAGLSASVLLIALVAMFNFVKLF